MHELVVEVFQGLNEEEKNLAEKLVLVFRNIPAEIGDEDDAYERGYRWFGELKLWIYVEYFLKQFTVYGWGCR